MKTLFTGDICPTKFTNESFAKADVKTLFTDTVQLFKEADFSFINLECAITDTDGAILKYGPNLKAPKATAKMLKELGVTVAGISNNHVFDFGRAGALDTIAELREAGVEYTGFGNDYEDSRKNYYYEKDGEVIAVVRFEVEMNKFVLELRQAGAELLKDLATTNVVVFGNMSGHLKGKSVPGENIREIKGTFDAGASLLLIKGGKVGPGTAYVSSERMRTAEKAFRIKDLNSVTDMPLSPDSDRKRFISSNLAHLRSIESSAASDIRSFIKDKKLPVTASFSGGKDSLAALGVLMKVKKDLELLFVDTGLEFPDTVQYVDEFVKRHRLRLHKAEAGDAFWKNVGTFGPPAKDFRWCCKVCKLGPITEMISKDFPKGTITIEGNRMLESFSRSKIGFVSKNPFVPNQTNLNPIRAWTSAEVWGYIWMRGLEYNPMYDRDFERIGCYLCASCLSSEWRNVGTTHPKLYKRWEDHLIHYAKERSLPKEYVDMGFWRWKVMPHPSAIRMWRISITLFI